MILFAIGALVLTSKRVSELITLKATPDAFLPIVVIGIWVLYVLWVGVKQLRKAILWDRLGF